MTVYFPDRAEQFTAQVLEELLNASAGVVSDVEATPVGTGQLASSYRLNISWREPGMGPDSVIAKCSSIHEANRIIGRDHQAYLREVSWYKCLATQTSANLPKCYFQNVSEEGDRFLLLLEDCSPATQGDQLAGADIEQVKKGLYEAALCHGPFMNNRDIYGHDFTSADRKFWPLKIETCQKNWPGFKERYASRLASDIFDLGDEFIKRLPSYMYREPSNFTVVHNDFRLDNLLFGEGDRATVVDWQTLGINDPMLDVSYFIGTSIADPAVRRAREPELLEYYLSCLRQSNITIDPDACWREYRIQALSGFLMAVFASMIVARTDRGDEMFAAMAERPGRQAIDLDSLAVLS